MFHHLEGLGNDLALTKLGYKYNDLYDDQPIRLLDILTANGRKMERLEISGNDFEDSTKDYYMHAL